MFSVILFFAVVLKGCVLCLLGADVRDVNMRDLTSGVLHTKFWVVDKKHVYIGSANMDWRSLTQVTFFLYGKHTF